MGSSTSFGYWVRRRRLALDLTQAALATRVGCSVPTVKKIERDERRPSTTMALRLAESLAVPEEERERFVAMALGERSPRREPLPRAPVEDPGPLPGWLRAAAAASTTEVVGRGDELAQLDRQLAAAVAGRGRVAFVAGEAGQGKTTLLTAYARRACAQVEDLVVARGYATAAAGTGDPYLPFRDLLLMLVAAPEAAWQADQLDVEQAQRLWSFAPAAAAAVGEVGPQLVGPMVPREALRPRVGEVPRAPAPAEAGSPRDQLHGQTTAVLATLAEQRPLLLLLDDLQWTDAASAELLFHLRRRLGAARVLLLGAYRPSEVADADTAGARTLRQVIGEARQTDPEAEVDLEALDLDAGRKLSDALLDREPNDLGEDFRAKLYWQTRGQPLFVVELLREMQARGELIRAADGRWAQQEPVRWQELPGRVSALIQQRLDRLGDDERALLEVAAVEGEHFTAEVTAAVAGLDVTAVLRTLGRQLDRVHGLVRETGAGHGTTRYRFAHVLFQHYLYAGLGEGERRALHARVAAHLEATAADRDEVIAALAHHYAEAGDAERAVPALLRAGDRARMLYAAAEAVVTYERAAGFLAEEPERLARTYMKLGLTHDSAFDHDRAQDAYDRAFSLWRTATRTAPPVAATETLRMAWADPPSMDPTMGGYNLSAPVVTQLFSGLVTHGEDDEVLPDVAERWTVTDGGRRYTFHLRDDVVWTDGTPVTAHDFAFTYRRALDPATGAPVAPSLLDTVRAVEAPDERTLILVLSEPTSYLLYNLAYYVLLPVPRHVVESRGTAWADGPGLVSNGAFALAEHVPGRRMRLVRNPRYHGTVTGNLAEVHLDLATPPEAQPAAYAEGALDLLSDWFVPGDVLSAAIHRFPGEHVRRPAFLPFFCVLDPSRPPLDDPAVRRALAMAIDREAIARGPLAGLVEAARGGFVPPGMPGHVADVGARHDPAEARRLLADAGADRGPELTLIGSPRWQHLVDSWRAVGMPSRLRDAEPKDWDAAWETLDGPRALVGGWWADYPDPDNFLRVCVGLNLPEWHHDRYEALIARAARTTDQPARLALYREAEHVLADEAVLLPLVYGWQHLLLRPEVRRYPTVAVKHPGFWKDVVVERR
jgi:ABC-type transport system substrate-binding protein/transcriptional regulator with XRE-family HTH domain/tetratricopeptide (TPR) repeat protein